MLREIARDFHKTRLSSREIGKKYGISAKSVELKAHKIDPISLTSDPDWCIIKVPREQMKLAELILQNNKIETDIPERFELIETFESSINQK